MTCGECGHTRASHTDGLRCHAIAEPDCICTRFVTVEDAHRHCYGDWHATEWMTPDELAAPRRPSR